MALKPSYEELTNFKKFLEGKGFEANDRIDPEDPTPPIGGFHD